ncbi:MAG: hypothetical protein L0Y60_15180, partial [Beijerinckiaceae bacterium]|nr:hypothetical protein [Beijerinckiaceae bacterium]
MVSDRTGAWFGRRLAAAGFVRIAGRAPGLLRRVLSAAMLVSLAACAVGPDFAAPSAPAAASWLEWRNKSLKTGDYEYRDWWRV